MNLSLGKLLLSFLLVFVLLYKQDKANSSSLSNKLLASYNADQDSVYPYFLSTKRDYFLSIGVVLDLVGRYYVDKDKLDNTFLLKETLSSISETLAGWTLVADVGYYNLHSQDHKFNIKIKKHLNNYELLKTLVDITKGVEDHTDIKDPLEFVVNKMLKSLDPYSVYLSKDNYKFLLEETNGAFGGIGVVVGIKDSNLTVIKPIADSPAYKAGIKTKDRIVAIEGVSTWGLSLTELVGVMRGEPGQEVKLTILRNNELTTRDIIVSREIIPVNSITQKHIEHNKKNFSYIKVESFSSQTSNNIIKVMKEFKEKHRAIDGMVLDLRMNPGGLLDQAVSVSDIFIDEGIILSTKGNIEEIEYAEPNRGSWDFPMVVVIDSNSASASEIVAGALQDHSRAIILGQRSYGKGSVQTVFQLMEERGLKMTIARYYTPHGYSIQAGSVIPDVYLTPVLEFENKNRFGLFRYKKENDYISPIVQLQKTKSVEGIIYKGYYLLTKKEINDIEKKVEDDPEVKAAVDVLSGFSETWDGKLRNFTDLREIYKKGLKNIDYIKKEDEKVRLHFEKNNITWKKNNKTKQDKQDVKIKNINWFIDEKQENKKIHFTATITNNSQDNIEELSFYLQSLDKGGYFYEILIGQMLPGKTVTKSIEIDVPFSMVQEKEMIVFNAGLAFGGLAERGSTKKVFVSFKGREVPKIVSSGILIEETNNSGALGVLENKESGKIKITIENMGSQKINNLSVVLKNLSGKQVVVSKVEKQIATLLPGKKADVLIDVMAGDKIFSNLLTLGLMVDAPYLMNPHYNTVQIKASPY